MERGAVYGVDRTTTRPEQEDHRGSQCRTLSFRGHCSQRLGGEGASEQQATLSAHQEGVRVTGRQGQGGDTHSATASALEVTQNYMFFTLYLHLSTKEKFGNHLKKTEKVLIRFVFFMAFENSLFFRMHMSKKYIH